MARARCPRSSVEAGQKSVEIEGEKQSDILLSIVQGEARDLYDVTTNARASGTLHALCARHVDIHDCSHFGSRLLCVCSLSFPVPSTTLNCMGDFKEFGPVLFASGGFGADLTPNSLLATCRPDLLHLPTATVSTALVTRSKWVRCNNHRSRVGPDAFHRLGEAGRPRCQNQVPRSRSARGVRGQDSDALGNRFANKTTLQERVVYGQHL